MTTELWAIGLVLFASFIGSFGPIFFKRGSKNIKLNIISLLKNYDLIIGIFFYLLSNVFFIPALSGGDLSILYPLVSTIYIWVNIWSALFLKEKLTASKWGAIGLILVGVILLSMG